MSKVSYSIPAIHCHHCVHTIEMEINEIEGVTQVKVDMDNKSVEIEFDDPATEELIIGTLKEIEYPPEIG